MGNKIMNYDNFCKKIDKIGEAVSNIGCRDLQFLKGGPASEKRVIEIEERLNLTLPSSFKQVLLEFSADFCFSYKFADNIEFPGKLMQIFGGCIYWKLDSFTELERNRKLWIDSVFPDATNEYDMVWHNKFVFEDVPNGDMIAFDISSAKNNDPAIIYLSHEDGLGHGFKMANNFMDLLERWSSIAFVGNEDWQWIPFVNGKDSCIIPNCKNAIKLRELINLSL
jgi:hypothetical protein